MDGYIMLFILFLIQLTHPVTSQFHEHSVIYIHPRTDSNQSDFGFSMAYQRSTEQLVVGAPTEDKQGKVYSCDLKNLTYKNESYCDSNNIDIAADAYDRINNPDQYFYMGASVAVAPNYSFACAPLMTSTLHWINQQISDVFGTCFVFDGTAHRYKGTLERYLDEINSTSSTVNDKVTLIGGTGWSTLIDETNDLLLIIKTSLISDFVYTRMSTPLAKTVSAYKRMKSVGFNLPAYRNVGYGVTAGNFFTKQKVYAISMTTKRMTGVIKFLQYNSTKNILTKAKSSEIIEDYKIGSMFGAALDAADLNKDGFADLLIGAPAYSDEDSVECGALYIYLGGTLKTTRYIVGVEDGARFGSAITSRDIDGDGIPEIIVSAPYEKGFGTVYVLSGYDIYHTLLEKSMHEKITIEDLKLTQRIKNSVFRRFGFSLQIVTDIDDNGCNELAVGAPQSGTVMLYKCIRSVIVIMSTRLIGEATFKTRTFTVEVCANIKYPEKPKTIVGELLVSNTIVGDSASIVDPRFVLNLWCESCASSRSLCRNVTIDLKTDEPADYTFRTQAKINRNDDLYSSKDFNGSAVIMSPHSKLINSIEITRHCDDDCKPLLSMEISWSGGNQYKVGSTSSETVSVLVRNVGENSYEACARIRVNGAPTANLAKCAKENEEYVCYLPKPLRRNTEHIIEIILNMTRLTNLEKELEVEGVLYERCNEVEFTQVSNKYNYIFSTNEVYVEGVPHDRLIASKELLHNDPIYSVQEYLITNNGSISWKNISAVISMEKETFVESYNEPMSKCHRKEDKFNVTFQCNIDVLSNTMQKIIVTQTINKKEIEEELQHQNLITMSQLTLFMEPTDNKKQSSVVNVVMYHSDYTFAQNWNLIILLAIIISLILIAVTAFVLYKCGFFKRKQNKRLEVLRESVRRRSSRRTLSAPAEEMRGSMQDGLLMDTGDDSPFDTVNLDNKDPELKTIELKDMKLEDNPNCQQENTNLNDHSENINPNRRSIPDP